MKKTISIVIILSVFICLFNSVFAEEGNSHIQAIPKLSAEEILDAPKIVHSSVYPFWGTPCTNYTYYAIYKDEEGRNPEYMRIWLNGEWHDMELLKGEPKTGATYVYNYVPASGKSNFYYFEASNGAGKARGSLIDSPAKGPNLFPEKLDNNEIVLLDKNGKEIWSYQTGKSWVEDVAISKDGNYIAAVTSFYIYLFSKDSNKPLWSFCKKCQIPSFVFEAARGIAISADGSYIVADLDDTLYFFRKESNEPLWTRDIASSAIGVDMSDNGDVIAAGTGNTGDERGQKLWIFDKEGNKLREYKAPDVVQGQTGDFYQPDVTPDGEYVAISTGCPDRRAYLFSGKGELLFKSEMLTEDSPVHKSAISDDGSLIAYSLDHQAGKELLVLFDNEGNKLWGFSSNDYEAKAVSISNDGNYVAIGTDVGHIYFFSKNSNKPIWEFSSGGYTPQIADMKFNSDGSLLAAGGATKKVYLFSKDSNKPLWEYDANTWVNKVDFNDEYIVAGTGPREVQYQFDESNFGPGPIQCKEIIPPESIENYLSIFTGDGVEIMNKGVEINMPGESIEWDESASEKNIVTVCGDGICESPEAKDTCCEDCGGCNGDKAIKTEKGITGEKSFFEKIIDFFRRLFG